MDQSCALYLETESDTDIDQLHLGYSNFQRPFIINYIAVTNKRIAWDCVIRACSIKLRRDRRLKMLERIINEIEKLESNFSY